MENPSIVSANIILKTLELEMEKLSYDGNSEMLKIVLKKIIKEKKRVDRELEPF